MADQQTSQNVRFVSVTLKKNYSPSKVKLKLLRSIRHSEKRERQATSISHPLSPWKERVHTLTDLPAGQVKKVVSNSRYFVFLLCDGRVCRLPVTSSAGRRRDGNEGQDDQQPSFQVLSDAEYARQLQSEYRRERGEGGGRRGGGGREGSRVAVVTRARELPEPEEMEQVFGSIPVFPNLVFDPSAPTFVVPSLPTSFDFLPTERGDMNPPIPPPRGPPMPPTSSWANPLSLFTNSSEREVPYHQPSISFSLPETSRTTDTAPSSSSLAALATAASGTGSKRDKLVQPWPVIGPLQWASDDGDNEMLFCDVAALHSEVLLVSKVSRQLFSWSCDEDENSATVKPHPLNEKLGLSGEAIAVLESSECRATIATVSGKLATFYDALLRDCPRSSPPSLIHSLSHEATEFPDLKGYKVAKLSVSNFLTVATTNSGRVFWWGLTPQPKKDPSPSSSSSSLPTVQRERKQGGGRGQISDGSLVRLKNGPPCGPNSIVFTTSSTHGPQVGRSVSVMERSSIDPKTSVLVKVFRDRTGSSSSTQSNLELTCQNFHGSTGNIYSGLEVWKLSDVVFLDDSPSILGRVIAVDGTQIVVDCSYSETGTDLGEGTSSATKSSLKVFRLSDLEGCIEGPDFGRRGSNISTGEPSTSTSNPQPPAQAITHHVAGVVQHRPVCLVEPVSFHLPSSSSSSTAEPIPQSQTGQLRGFRSLATHASDSGPNLLVERVSDQAAFLVCSSHLTMSGINGTSFVAVGNHDTKKKRSTVSEESVNSIESGLTTDVSLTLAVQSLSNKFKTGSQVDVSDSTVAKKTTEAAVRKSKEVSSGKNKGTSSKKGKGVSSMAGKGASSRGKRSSKHVTFQRDKVAMDTGPGSTTVCPGSVPKSSSLSSCEFVPLSPDHPDLFFVRDAGGTVWPMLEGLCLAPIPTPPGWGATARPKRPVQSYRCIGVRQYAVQGEDSVAIFVLVPQPKTLLSAVQNGAIELVDSIISDLCTQINSLPFSNTSTNNDTRGDCVPVKPVLETGKTSLTAEIMDTSESPTGKTGLASGGEATVPEKERETKSERRKRKSEVSVEPHALRKRRRSKDERDGGEGEREQSTAKCPPAVTMEIGGKTLPNEGAEFEAAAVLLETGVDNCNILHVCCGGEGGGGGLPAEELTEKRLDILDRILSCKPVRPVITKLICCRNAYGHVPFQHALTHHNYAAALRLLEFVTETLPGEWVQGVQGAENRKIGFQSLFSQSILDPGSHGVPPLHSLVTSFSDCTDIVAMKLHVSRLPQSYTAQQLLKLFQKRYPSVYKTRIFKEEEEEEEGGEEERSEDGDSEEELQEGGLPGVRLPGLSQALGGRRRQQSFFNTPSSSMTSQRGVVYFSELHQLRAAVKEMHNYRLVTRTSRSGGFASQVTSVCYLDVRLDDDFGQSDDDDDHLHGNHPLLTLTHGNLGDQQKYDKGKIITKLSTVQKAHLLFTKLLSCTQVCTAVTKGGDTALMTLVHNPKVMAALQQASSCHEDETSTTSGGIPPSLLALSDMLDGRHSTSQYGTETSSRRKTNINPTKMTATAASLFTGSRGNWNSSSSLATKPGPSPLLVSSLSSLTGPKPVNSTSDAGLRNSPVDMREFPQILSILKKEDQIIANFAAGKAQEPSTSNFDLLTSVFRGSETSEAAVVENVNNKQQQPQQQMQQQQSVEGHSVSSVTTGSGLLSGSNTTLETGTGLRLAQYTLEGIPPEQTQGTQSRVSSRLLELMSSAKNTLLSKPPPSSDAQETTTIDLPVNPVPTDFSSASTASDSVRAEWAEYFHEGIRKLMNLQLHFYLRGLLIKSDDMPVVKDAPVECLEFFHHWFSACVKKMKEQHTFSQDPEDLHVVREMMADKSQDVFEMYLSIAMSGIRIMLIDPSKIAIAVETGKQTQASTSESDVVMETQPTTSSSVAKTDERPETQQLTAKPPAEIATETAPSDVSSHQKAEDGKKFQPKSLFTKKNVPSKDSESNETISENDFLSPLFTNWPCVVTTILGCYPPVLYADRATLPQVGEQAIGQMNDPFQVWPSQSRGLSSVQSLDGFTSHLVLNCDEDWIENFTSTIVEKINSCLAESNQCSVDILDLSVHDIDLRLINERALPILVGKRFLESVIRVLGMEHSRVKNTFVEMQQLRARGGGEGEGGRRYGGGGRGLRSDIDSSTGPSSVPRNIVKVTKSILARFSWLAVASLSCSADMAATPVTLGISKPMGASSVSAEYSSGGPRHGGSSSYRGGHRQPEDLNWSHQRQLHVRSAYHTPNLPPLPSHSILPPTEGVTLRPVARSDVLNSERVSGSAMGEVLNAEVEMGSSQESSFDEDAGSDQDTERQGSSFLRSPSDASYIPMSPPNPSNLIDPHLLGIWSSSSSSDEDGYVNHETFFTFEEAADTMSPPRQREHPPASPDNIYPFAWALDGRRIGESSTSSLRSDSPSHFLFGGHHEQNMPLFTIPSVRFGAGFLSRTFSRFVKDLVDIAVIICDNKATKTKLVLPERLQAHLVRQTLSQLESTWRWVIKVLDVAEGQLQRGQNFDVQRHVMSLRSDGPTPTTSSHTPSHDSYRSFIGSTPAEYMTYLLRAHAREDTDCLPVIDLYGYEHVVFVLDALIYTLTHWPKAAVVQTDQSNPSITSAPSSSNQSTNQNTAADQLQMEHTSGAEAVVKDDRFFQRSESILASSGTSESEGDHETRQSNQKFFGPRRAVIESPDFVGNASFFGGGSSEGRFSQPLSEAYPLAQQPHLLRPNAKKEQLFSSPGRLGGEGGGEGGGGGEEKRKGKRELPVSYDSSDRSSPAIHPPVTLSLSVDAALQRWHNCISVFAHVFLAEGPGGERDNFLNARAGFASRMARFRQQVSQLYDAAMTHREWSSSVSNSLSLKIRRDCLLQDALDNLNQLTKFHYSQVRVKFEGEEGSGPGVNRGFFSSLSNELKSSDTSKPVLKQVGVLLSEPGKQPEQSGLFAPCPFVPSHTISPSKLSTIREQRIKYFRAIGRFLGLCFWFRYTVPLMVCRHVAKYLLGRDLAWHDLAFYNADLYEGLRRMLQDIQEDKKSEEDFMNTYCCYFEAPLSGSVEPLLVDLIPGGSTIPVTPDRIQEYVRLYATFMMYGCVCDELKAMKDGLHDVIPPELLSGLTAEDFQLLLSGGSASISLSRLKSVIRFNHTHGSSPSVCDRFEKMFWRVVSHMTNSQRQELLYFATGSGALPSTSETSDQSPALQITINVIGTGNTKSLPVASTCSQRMSIPLYPSYLILKKKLLQAIQCQAYGLG